MPETPREFMELLQTRFKEKPEAGKDVNANLPVCPRR